MELQPLKDLLRRQVRPSESYCDSPEELVGGNLLAPLRDGKEAYPAMLEAIASASTSVHLETYILRSDRTGWLFARALAERARAGVQTRLIFDSLGSLGIDGAYLQHLRNQGVQLLEYRPVAPWRRRWGWGRRDHRKILVVDGRIAFTGGINIADDYADPAHGGGGWRDYHVRIEGPAAYELERLFRAVWYRETRRWFHSAGRPDPAPGNSRVHVAANQEFVRRHLIRRSYLHAIREARRRILIANTYFIPDRGIRRELYAAVERGVDVRVLLPETSDVPVAAYASRHLYARHLRRGVGLYAWPGALHHAKVVVVDGAWASLGSYNMDHRSWLHNLEVTLNVLDPAFAARLEELLIEDFSRARRIEAAVWERRPLLERALEQALYLCRYWL